MSKVFDKPAPRLYQPEAFRKVLRDAELNGDETLEDFVQATLIEQDRRSKRHRLPELAASESPRTDPRALLERILQKLGCC